jgi:hypothetical protein
VQPQIPRRRYHRATCTHLPGRDYAQDSRNTRFCLRNDAPASTLTSEITDMWWVPSESGWGVNIVLQYGTVFATFFVYDSNKNPVWYTAQLSYQGTLCGLAPCMQRRDLGSVALSRRQ